jgi:hypothetical protein
MLVNSLGPTRSPEAVPRISRPPITAAAHPVSSCAGSSKNSCISTGSAGILTERGNLPCSNAMKIDINNTVTIANVRFVDVFVAVISMAAPAITRTRIG